MKSYWFWAIGSMCFYGIGEWASKKWSLSINANRYLFLLFFGYMMNVVCWLPALKSHGSISILGTIYSTLYTIMTIVVGTLIFGEAVSIKQWIGISFAILAIGLLS